MIVVDASAAVLGLLSDGEARESLASEVLIAPYLIDVEIAHALRGQVLRRAISAAAGGRALTSWSQMGVERIPTVGLLDRVWALRANLSGYDATYVATAEAMGCVLLTADRRLAAAPGPRCTIATVRT